MKTLVPIALALTLAACTKHKEAAVLTPAAAPMTTQVVVITERTPAQQQQEQAMHENFSRVYFDFDESSLNMDSQAALDENVAIMMENPMVSVEIQGHADEVGTDEYNIELGDRRAESIHDYMVAQGVPADRLRTVSFGERRLVSDGDGASQKDRRAEFRVLFGDEDVSGTTAAR